MTNQTNDQHERELFEAWMEDVRCTPITSFNNHLLLAFKAGRATWAAPSQQSASQELTDEDILEITDTQRLDFVLNNSAFTVNIPAFVKKINRVQLLTQDEDENYIALSGEEKYFATEREAVDAAILLKGTKNGN